MYKKKILLLSFTIYFIFSMSGCQALNSSIINLEKVKVAYVINKGCLEDKGLNELGLEGVNKAATELGVKITTIEIDKSNEQNFQKEFIKATKSNDLIIVVGDDFNNVVNEAATNYRDKKFIVTSNKIRESNVQNISFKYEEGGFLAGVLAGRKSTNKEVGYIAIKDSEPNKQLLSGYMAGVKITNPSALSKLLSSENVKYIEDCTKIDIAYNEALKLYGNGCEVILTDAGRASEGVFKAAKEKGKYVINIGMDAREVYSDYRENILGSLKVNFDKVLYASVSDVKKGLFKSGKVNKINEGLKENTLEVIINDALIDIKTIDLINTYKSQVIKEKIEIPKIKEEVLEFKVQ